MKKKTSNDLWRQLVKKGGVINTNVNLYRITTKKASGVQTEATMDRFYVSLAPSENSRYTFDLGAKIGDMSYKLNPTKPLKIPSLDETNSIYIKILNEKGFETAYNKNNDTMYNMKDQASLEDFKRLAKGNPDRLASYLSAEFANGEGFNTTSTYVAKRMKEEILKRGYNGLIDHISSDRRANREDYKADLIIFGKTSAQIAGKEQIDKLFLKEANRELKSLDKAMAKGKKWLEKYEGGN